MNAQNCSACENCRSDCRDDRRRFWSRTFEPGMLIHVATGPGHLLFIVDGEIEVADAEGVYACKKDEMVLLAYNKEYRVRALTRGKLLVLDFTTHYHVCDDMHAERVWRAIRAVQYRFNTLEMRPAMLRFVESVVYYLEQGACCYHLYDAKNVEISVIYRSFYRSDELVRFFHPVMYKDLAFDTLVRKNHEQAKTVQELAVLCGYGLSNFKKLFVKHFGVSPYQWMLQRKSARIKSRLLDKTIPIKSVASEFGFADQSHLNAYCKRYLNATPLQIRNGSDDKSEL